MYSRQQAAREAITQSCRCSQHSSERTWEREGMKTHLSKDFSEIFCRCDYVSPSDCWWDGRCAMFSTCDGQHSSVNVSNHNIDATFPHDHTGIKPCFMCFNTHTQWWSTVSLYVNQWACSVGGYGAIKIENKWLTVCLVTSGAQLKKSDSGFVVPGEDTESVLVNILWHCSFSDTQHLNWICLKKNVMQTLLSVCVCFSFYLLSYIFIYSVCPTCFFFVQHHGREHSWD